MKKCSFIQISASLLSLLSVQCLPATTTTTSGTPGHGKDVSEGKSSTVQTMGILSESNCQGSQMVWDKASQPNPWQKLSLAQNLNLYQNVWQSDKVSAGGKSQITCSKFNGASLSWSNTFAFPCAPQDKNQVKTYANAAWAGKPIQLTAVQSFKSSWNWTLTQASPDLVMDVSYDIFLTTQIWPAAVGGAKPSGTLAGVLKVGTYEFEVWQGTVNVPVISLIPSNPQTRYTGFQADLKAILLQLQAYGLSKDEFVLSVGAGIEVFTGSGKFDTSSYTIDLF
ncbi:hypothetical protein VP01_3641g4 [Puccinia sorghi]|uniref:Uncharacterized protein n=1 Tax=Puccinia sorghi TaxID=27349 RepID=A0A0L6UVE4_9BASI|nr:hypothetical protein VP01_3641g4 [Puccinia sorghi]